MFYHFDFYIIGMYNRISHSTCLLDLIILALKSLIL